MESVMISIKPKWCELIASGKKTVEVRKTRPKCETPFKCYIYETKIAYNSVSRQNDSLRPHLVPGKVIGEFVCDYIDKDFYGELTDYFEQCGCVTRSEQIEYAGNKTLYGWHISDLKIYDEPKELSEFYALDTRALVDDTKCDDCPHFDDCDISVCQGRRFYFRRPPESWCYCEDQTDELVSNCTDCPFFGRDDD